MEDITEVFPVSMKNMITLGSTRKGSKTTDYSIFQTVYNPFLNDNFPDTPLQALALAIVVFTTLYNLTNLTCLVFLYLWFSSLAHRHRGCCSSIGRAIGCPDVSRPCGERKGRPIRVLRARSCGSLNRRKRAFMRLTPLQKHLITDQRYPSLHSGYKRSPDQPLSYCSGETANSSLNGASEPSPLFAYRTEKLHHPWSYYSGETANSSLNGASEPSPLFAYRTEKLHYPAFHNDIIRTLSKTRGKDANSKHRKYQKHPKHSTEKLKHRAVPDQLNHERTTFKKKI